MKEIKEIKENIERIMNDTLSKLDTDIIGDVYDISKDEDQIQVTFSDCEISAVLAGYIPVSTYDQMESALLEIGLEPYDSSGATWFLEFI